METTQVEVKLVQIQSDRGQFEQLQPEEASPLGGVVSLVPIGFILVWTIAIMVYLILSKATREAAQEVKFTLHTSSDLPCRNCRFFSGNPYLRCAVHPTTVMTKAATDCSDYQPQETKELPRRKLKR